MTPEERAAERYPQPTAHIPTAEGWKTLNHRADGYAACVRELVEPLEARIKELEGVVSEMRQLVIGVRQLGHRATHLDTAIIISEDALNKNK